MFTGNPVHTHESGTRRGIVSRFTASSLCYFKGTSPQPDGRRRGINISGVDFWHAVEFSRNGRFLCTHPLGLSSGRFPSVLRFRLYQIFPIRFPVDGIALGSGLSPVGLSTFTTLADSPARFIIGLCGLEFGHAGTPKTTPLRVFVSSGLAAPAADFAVPGSAARATLRAPSWRVNLSDAWGRGPDRG